MYLVSNKNIKKYIVFISLIYIIPYSIDFLYVLTQRIYLSDLTFYKINVGLPWIYICFIYMKGLLWYLFGIILCLLIHNRKYKTNYFVIYRRRVLEFTLIIFFIIQIFFAYKYKIGSAGGHSGNKLSALMNLINIEVFFPIYYFLYREKTNKKYFFILFLYIALKIIQGWSGFVLSLFFMEIFYRIYKERISKKFLLIIPIVLLLGGLAYKIMYPVKIFVRTGSFETIKYFDALIKLVTRLSCFSNSCASYEYLSQIINNNNAYNIEHGDILYFFNAITPSFLYNKTFQPLNRLLLISVVKGGDFSNFDLGSSYYTLLFKISILDFIVYFEILIVNSVISRFAYEVIIPSSFCIYNAQIFSSSFYLTFLLGGGLNTMSTWVFIIFPIAFMFIIGGIKIYKRRQ